MTDYSPIYPMAREGAPDPPWESQHSYTECSCGSGGDGGGVIPAAMRITYFQDDPIRSGVEPEVGGQVLLDRGTSQAFSETAEFRDTRANFKPGSDRWPTTGHDNLLFSCPLAPYHTYSTTGSLPTPGNLWDPNYDYATLAAPIAEILNISAYGALWRTFQNRPHIFTDWQRAYSTGQRDPADPDNPDALYWYRDPFALNINENPIDPVVLAGMDARDFKKLENRRFIRRLIEDEGLRSDMCINIGGEDWVGWEPPFPWLPPSVTDDPAQMLKFQWLAESIKPILLDLKAYTNSKTWPVKYCVGYLESTESGEPLPLTATVVERNLAHFNQLLDVLGPHIDFLSSSMHLRQAWTHVDPVKSFLDSDELMLSWFVPGPPTTKYLGMGTLAEIRRYFLELTAVYPQIDMLPMADGVGDPKGNGPQWEQWQKGLGAAQYLIELIKGGYKWAQDYIGFEGDNAEGKTGLSGTTSGGGVFTLWPRYYALQLLTVPLWRGADVLSSSREDAPSSPTGLIDMCMRWDEGGSPVMGVVTINKRASTQIKVKLTGLSDGYHVRLVKRFSESETTAPEIDISNVLEFERNEFLVTLKGWSITYFEVAP